MDPDVSWERPAPAVSVQLLAARLRKLASVEVKTVALPSRMQVIVWLGLVILFCWTSLSRFTVFQVGTYTDDAVYTILARTLAQPDQYGGLDRLGSPEYEKFPFGFPLILAPFAALFPDNVDALRVPSFLAILSILAALFWGWSWLGRGFSHWWALAVLALFSLAPTTVDFSRMVMSEPVFAAAGLLLTICIERFISGKRTPLFILLTAVALVFSIYTRFIGVYWLAALPIYLLLTRGKQAWKSLAVFFSLAGLVLALIIALTPVEARHLWPGGYVQEFTDKSLGAPRIESAPSVVDPPATEDSPSKVAQAWLTVRTKFKNYFILGTWFRLRMGFRSAVFPIGGGPREQAFAARLGLSFLPGAIGLAVSGAILLGYAAWIRKSGLTLFNFSAILYFLALYLWIWNDPRFLFPILPQLVLAFLLGIDVVYRFAAARLPKAAFFFRLRPAMLAVLVLIMTGFSIWKAASVEDSRIHAGDVMIRSEWLKEHALSSEIFISESPFVDFVYSGRKALPYPVECLKKAELEAFLTERQASYVLVAPRVKWWDDGFQPRYSLKGRCLLQKLNRFVAEGKMEIAYESQAGRIRVYRILQ